MLDIIKKIRNNFWVLLAVSLALLIVGVLLKPTPGYVTDFTPQQAESVTELYFEDHTQLPQRYKPGDKQDIRFTVRNTGQNSNNYRYEIFQQDALGGNSHTLKTGEMSVQGNTSQTETAMITYVDAGKASTISIRLIQENQLIRFWMDVL